MSLSDLAAIGSFISGLAVLFSFVFLALQIRQNARHQRATIHNERAALVQELVISVSDSESAEIGLRGSAADQTLDAVQIQKYLNQILSRFRLIEEFFYQHRDGMLDEVRWETNVLRLRTFLPAPGLRAAWRTLSGTFRSDYAQWVNQMMAEVPVASGEGARVEAWKEFGRLELAAAMPDRAIDGAGGRNRTDTP